MDTELANRLKIEGDRQMEIGELDNAVEYYTEAIKLQRDSVFFYNRAAAYFGLQKYDAAISDCQLAIDLDANYSKAYSLALSCQNRCKQAAQAYEKALVLEQDEDCENQLHFVESKIREKEHSETTQPLILNSGSATNEMNAREKFSIFEHLETPKQKNERLKKQQRLHVITAVLGFCLIIALFAIIFMSLHTEEKEISKISGKKGLESVEKEVTERRRISDDPKSIVVTNYRWGHNPSSPSLPDLVNFIKDGLNTSVSPCHDFYEHVCGNHSSSSNELLRRQFFQLIIPVIINDTKHPKISKLLRDNLQECVQQKRNESYSKFSERQFLNGFGLDPMQSEAIGENFNFLLPLVRILFSSPLINTKILHKITFGNNTVSFHGDPDPLTSGTIFSLIFKLFYVRYLNMMNIDLKTDSPSEYCEVERFADKFQMICAESVNKGSISTIEVEKVRNIHFREALQKMLPLWFRQDFMNMNDLFGKFRVSFDEVMIAKLQLLFKMRPHAGQKFLMVLALSSFNHVILAKETDTWNDSMQSCLLDDILSSRRFPIFNLYVTNFMVRGNLLMTNISEQIFVRNFMESIRQTIKDKLSSTVWLKSNRELIESLDRLLDVKKAVGPSEDYESLDNTYELDRFEKFLSLHQQTEDRALLISLANSRLEIDSEFQFNFITTASFDGSNVHILQMHLQRPLYGANFPASYNYGFMGSTVGHEFFHQLTPRRVNDFWLTNERIATLGFDLDSKNLQYFEEKSEGKPSKTLLNMKGTEITHNITCPMAEFDFGGVLLLATVLILEYLRYDESMTCFTEFYDICFNLTLSDVFTNGTKVRKVCVTGMTDRTENIADIEGTRVAFETMKSDMGVERLKERAMPEFDYTNEQMFFVATAQLHCDKNLKNHDYVAADLTDDDPHGTGNVRVNAIAMQMSEFANAFGCTPNDKMVTTENKKCYLLPIL